VSSLLVLGVLPEIAVYLDETTAMLASYLVRFAYCYLVTIYGYAKQSIAHTTRAQLLTGKNRKIP
jgi:hypothetical protein